VASADSAGRVILVDAHSLVFQCFHAIQNMVGPDGRPVNALFGFTRDLFFMRDDLKPDYLLCAFDLPEPTFRSELYPDYKAHRPPPPDDLNTQVPRIQAVIAAMNLPVLTAVGFEADDVMATVAAAAEKRGLEVLMATSDKDCRQLITDRVRLFNLRKRTEYGKAELLADWGVAPEQVVDFQALVGDSVDNVPGVPGVGPKTAAKLLQQFGTLDNLLAHVDDLPKGKMKENIVANVEKVKLSRKLVRLDTNVALAMDWDEWRVHDYDAAKLLPLFEEAGFRGFSNKMRQALGGQAADIRGPREEVGGQRSAVRSQAAVAEGPRRGGEGGLFGDASEPEDGVGENGADDFPFGANAPTAAANWCYDKYCLVDTPAKFDAFLKGLKKQKRFAIDLETTDLDPLKADLVGLAITWEEACAHYLPVRGPEGSDLLDKGATLKALKSILENPKVAKVNQNIKYDLLVLRQQGIDLQGVAGDPMIAHYLLHAGERSHGLDDLAQRLLNHTNISITQLIGKGKAQIRMDQVATQRVAEYSGEDVDVAMRLANMLEAELKKEKLDKLYGDVEIRLIDVLADLEFNGIRLDVPFLNRLSTDMAAQLETIEKEIHGLAGHEFNIASPKQLRVVLFNELKLPAQKRTATSGEASTDQETLEKLAAIHPLPKKITEHRQLAKLKGTYVDALPALVNPETGRVHTSFNQTVAATGRLSSSDPNLQNIPARTEMGQQIRKAFIPRDGWQLLTADYSQVELRLLAHFSGDANLKAAFAEEKDIHTSVAAEIFKVPEAKVNSEQRRVAKTVNFGVIYGMSGHGLGTRLGISVKEASQFIDDYFDRFRAVAKYQERLLQKCAKEKCVGTILGRRRQIEGVRDLKSYDGLNQPEREAVNMEIQGSAADLMKLAMLDAHRRLRDEKFQAKMLLTVHDELVFEAPPKEIRRLAVMVRHAMSGAMKLTVPLAVDVAAGPNWLEVEDVKC
jgi:DNA polymerase-1